MKKGSLFIFCLFFICSCLGCGSDVDSRPVDIQEGGRLYKVGPVSVLQLHGTHYQMGRQYGKLLKKDLAEMYDSMIATFAPHWSYKRMKQIAEALYLLYPRQYKDILIGMAETSGLGIERQIILNSIEFIPLLSGELPQCAGIAAWGDYTEDGTLFFGRNQDDIPIYKRFAKYAVVAVFNPTDGQIPTAIVNYAGAIYATNGMNRDGIFMEYNGGNTQPYFVNRPLIFTSLFSFLQNRATQEEINEAFKSVLPNISSIVNVADSRIAYSFECPVTGVKRRNPDAPGLLVSTNHFLDPSWGLPVPGPTDDSVVRRNNLLALANGNKGLLNLEKMKQIMDRKIEQGGATNEGTIFQIVAVPRYLTIWLKAPDNFDWRKIELGPLFIKAP